MRSLLLLLLGAATSGTALAAGPRAVDWGQGDPAVVWSVFAKVVAAARSESREPRLEAAVQLSDDYLLADAPAVAAVDDGRPVVRVARAALDLTRSEGEMAFVLGHELRHALARQKKRLCLSQGLRANGGDAERLKRSSELRAYALDLEREADSWGQRYMADAGYDPGAAVAGAESMRELGRALGADPAEDPEHEDLSARRAALEQFAAPRFDARCPWSDDGRPAAGR